MKYLLLVLGCSVAVSVAAADYATMPGEQLYRKFCASCHGTDARGDGPMAAVLKTPPADLTRIAVRYGGFPARRIAEVIDGRIAVGAHGTSAMPVWGEEFTRSQAGEREAERDARLIIERIVEYLRGLQRVE